MATGSKRIACYGSGSVGAKVGFYRRWYRIGRLGGAERPISALIVVSLLTVMLLVRPVTLGAPR